MELLIDPGASTTQLDRRTITPLGLVSTGETSIHTPSTEAAAPYSCALYDVSLTLPPSQGANLVFERLPILDGAFRHQGIDGLLARDVLAHCVLVLNGPLGVYTLAF
jgi:hypothetical protein